MPQDPLLKDVKRNYAKSHAKKIDDLLAQQTRWQRKRTIADNKLAEVRKKIDALANEQAAALDKGVAP